MTSGPRSMSDQRTRQHPPLSPKMDTSTSWNTIHSLCQEWLDHAAVSKVNFCQSISSTVVEVLKSEPFNPPSHVTCPWLRLHYASCGENQISQVLSHACFFQHWNQPERHLGFKIWTQWTTSGKIEKIFF